MSSIKLEPQMTALVLIDLQQGIASRQLAPHSGSEVVANAAKLAAAFRRHRATVVLVRVELGELLALDADQPAVDPSAPAPPAEALQLVKEIGPEVGDIVVTKRQWGAFHATGLDQQLRRRGIRTLVLGGIATNFGVESTARAAAEHGYEQVFVPEMMTSLSTEAHEFAIRHIFPRIGRVRGLATVLQALEQ